MMIQSIGAISNNTNTNGTVKKPQPAKPSFEGFGVNKAPKTMKALAAAAILGMAAVGMSSCKQPTDPTVIEIPAKEPTTEDSTTEDPTVEDPEIEDPEIEDPTVEDPEIEDPEIEDPTVEDPEIEDPEIEDPTVEDSEIENPEIEDPTNITNVQDTKIYKTLNALDFVNVQTEDIAPISGQYTPKIGDITYFSYNRKGATRTSDEVYSYTLNRARSSEGNLVYNASLQNLVKPERNQSLPETTITVDKETKSIHLRQENGVHYDFKLNDSGTMTYSLYNEGAPNQIVTVPTDYNENHNLQSTNLYAYEFKNITVKLANPTDETR